MFVCFIDYTFGLNIMVNPALAENILFHIPLYKLFFPAKIPLCEGDLIVEKHHLCILHAAFTRNVVWIYQCFPTRNVVFIS
jgi:hypothetical protein